MFHASSSPVLIPCIETTPDSWKIEGGMMGIHPSMSSWGDEVGDEPVVLADTQAPVGNFDTRKFRV